MLKIETLSIKVAAYPKAASDDKREFVHIGLSTDSFFDIFSYCLDFATAYYSRVARLLQFFVADFSEDIVSP